MNYEEMLKHGVRPEGFMEQMGFIFWRLSTLVRDYGYSANDLVLPTLENLAQLRPLILFFYLTVGVVALHFAIAIVFYVIRLIFSPFNGNSNFLFFGPRYQERRDRKKIARNMYLSSEEMLKKSEAEYPEEHMTLDYRQDVLIADLLHEKYEETQRGEYPIFIERILDPQERRAAQAKYVKSLLDKSNEVVRRLEKTREQWPTST